MSPERFDELQANALTEPDGRVPLLSAGDVVECLDEIARLAAMVYVLGGWHCPKCKFRLVSSVLYAKTGNVAASRQIPDPCPNDGTPLEPDTWRQDAMEMSEHMPKVAVMDRINSLRENEGASVTIMCDNPDGPPNNAIEVCDDWTGWELRRFDGESLIRCLVMAEDAKMKAKTNTEDIAPKPKTQGRVVADLIAQYCLKFSAIEDRHSFNGRLDLEDSKRELAVGLDAAFVEMIPQTLDDLT